MKRLFLRNFLLLGLTVILVGCSNSNKTIEPDLTIGDYVMEASEDIMKPILKLKENNEYIFNFSPLSSYYNHGHYEEEDGNLILKTDDSIYKYVFAIKDDTLNFN